MATIKDIAKLANVSTSTVSKGLSDATDISTTTRNAVLEAARQLGYTRRQSKGKICILIKNMGYETADQFGYEILRGFCDQTDKSGYKVVIKMEDSNETDYVKLIAAGGYSGGFLLGHNLGDKFLKDIEKVKTPTVLLDNFVRNKLAGYTGTDNYEGITLAVEELVKNGHTRIALFNGEHNSQVSIERRQAFKTVLLRYGLPVVPEIIIHSSFTENQAAQYVPVFLEHGATAIVCASDTIAGYAIHELTRLGKRVPDDISITGFDDMPFTQFTTPPLTTVGQNRFEIGRCAFNLLRSIMQGIYVSKMLIRPTLVVRSSIKNLNQ